MARYMETAKKANDVAIKLLTLIPEDARPEAAGMMAQLVNLGVRCNPRACMATVRLNAVRRAIQGLPVKVSIEQVPNSMPGRKPFNALVVEPVAEKQVFEKIMEGDDGGDE